MFYSLSKRPPRVFSNIDPISMTQQSAFDETDTYSIIEKYRILGAIPNQRDPRQALYGDFTNVNNMRDTLDSFTRLQQSFEDLPSALRRKYGDDPLQYADYLNRLYSGTATIDDVETAKAFNIDFDKSKYEKGNVLNSLFTSVSDDYLKELSSKGYKQMTIMDAINSFNEVNSKHSNTIQTDVQVSPNAVTDNTATVM